MKGVEHVARMGKKTWREETTRKT